MKNVRRRVLLILLIGIALCLVQVATAARAKENAKLPNIIVIFADDMGYGDIGINGAEGYTTPNIDRMAAEGMQFAEFCAGRSVCSPSRAALMTGCYPLRVGVKSNFGPKSTNGLHPDEMT
ncbi:MAG: sulfatase-like hydrolase/transferase, partial [Planctomycetes bacterium]|nr:sulfatase-like hydrolase/transferase [Planctomycetota bacterium]